MVFNRQGLQQKNWRMVKKGKHILFGCSLFFVVGGVSVIGPQVTYASEIKSSELSVKQDNISNKNTAVRTSELNNEKQTESLNNTTLENNTLSESKEEIIPKKEANKEELKNLVDKIKRADISKKAEKSVKELNIVLSRAEKALDNKEITQEEIDKEVKLLKEVFEKLEDKPREDKKSEIKEKDDKSNSEKDTKEKQQVNNTEDVARRYNEKITKATNIVKEINSLASGINYEFSDSEKELVSTIEKLPTTDNNSEESIQKLLNEEEGVLYRSEQGKILTVLWDSVDGRATSTDIAIKTGLANNTLTSMIEKLIQQGLVSCEHCTKDKRKKYIILTQLGWSQKEIGDRVSKKLADIFYEGFQNEEIKQFEKFQERILDNLVSFDKR